VNKNIADVTELPNTQRTPPIEEYLDNTPFEEQVRRDAFNAAREAEKASSKKKES
jgi:hypothetical protein